MGSGATKPGVPPNPRISYADQLSKKEKMAFHIDAPVLVEMQHGTVRFREVCQDGSTHRQMPHEGGSQLDQKKHYFYHTRLKTFGQDADKSTEDPMKFVCVTKGPALAQNKKLFYIYGKGWNAADGRHIKPTHALPEEGSDFAWPRQSRPNDLVYSLHILSSSPKRADGDDEHVQTMQDLVSTPDKSNIRMEAMSEDRVHSVKVRLAVKLLKAAANIVIFHGNQQLRDDDVIGDLRPQEEREPSVLDIQLTLL